MSSNDSNMELEEAETSDPKPKKPRTTAQPHAAAAAADADSSTQPPPQQQKRTVEELEALLAAQKIEALLAAQKVETAAQIAEKDGQITALNEALSVKKLLELGVPRMRINEFCKPAIAMSNVEAQGIVEKYRLDWSAYLVYYAESKKAAGKTKTRKALTPPQQPDRYKFHEPAKIDVEEIDHKLLKSMPIHMVDDVNGWLIKSTLAKELAAHRGARTLPHCNETSPQDYLCMVLKDVIECCGLMGTFLVVKETTLFSMRPDLVVVLLNGRLFLVAEVKNPDTRSKNTKSADVFASETVGGQMLDYMKALKQQGMDWPFALLSTYNDSVIARLPGDDYKYATIIDEALKNAASDDPVARKSRYVYASHSDKPPISPSKDAFCQDLAVISPTMPDNEDSDSDLDLPGDLSDNGAVSTSGSSYDYKGRGIVYSQSFGVEDLYKLVTLAVECSWIAFKQSTNPKKSLMPTEGGALQGDYCTLYESGFAYEKVNIEEVTFNKAPRLSRMNRYHVICQIGQGGSGKTMLCSSSGGKLFVAKLFIPQASTAFHEEDRNRESDDLLASKIKEAKEECDRWKLLVPEYAGYCAYKTMNCLPAITMPYFPPVPFEQRERAIEPITKLLKDLAKDHKLYYKQSDLRWRHFGCRWSDEKTMDITLLDLGSMSSEAMDIGEQLDQLKTRMKNEELPQSKLPIVK